MVSVSGGRLARSNGQEFCSRAWQLVLSNRLARLGRREMILTSFISAPNGMRLAASIGQWSIVQSAGPLLVMSVQSGRQIHCLCNMSQQCPQPRATHKLSWCAGSCSLSVCLPSCSLPQLGRLGGKLNLRNGDKNKKAQKPIASGAKRMTLEGEPISRAAACSWRH